MGFLNSVVDSNDEDDNISKPERRFLLPLMLLMCKNDKNTFKFAFPESPEILETHAQKTFNLQHNCEIKMPRIMVFWSDREIKNTAKYST